METPRPPDDPEAWSDEEWLAWLEATDDAGEPDGRGPQDDETRSALPRVIRSTPGYILYEAMIGAHNAIYGAKERPPIIAVAPGDPYDDPPVKILYDPDHPDQAVVVVRNRGTGTTPAA